MAMDNISWINSSILFEIAIKIPDLLVSGDRVN
jgi:hypothetical protein